MSMLVVVREQDKPILIPSAEMPPSTPQVRRLQSIAFLTLNVSLQKVGEENYDQLLRLTLSHVMGKDYPELNKELSELPDPIRYLQMAQVVVDLLEDPTPCVVLITMSALMSATRLIELRRISS